MPVVPANSERHLPVEEFTVGEVFAEAGYQTAWLGKWHLGAEENYWAGQQGFEVVVGGDGAPSPKSYFDPYGLDNVPSMQLGQYLTDRMVDDCGNFLDQVNDRPFLAVLSHYAVHQPIDGKPELIDAALLQQDPSGRQENPVMAAMIASIDEGVGRIMAMLEEYGLREDTMVVFTSDNGGAIFPGQNGLIPTNNAPLRGGKATIYEGGLRVPLILNWPGHIPKGVKSTQPVISQDLLSTIASATGVAPNQTIGQDGIDLTPLWTGSAIADRDLFWHFPHYAPAAGQVPASAIRRDRWKLIRLYGEGPDQTTRIELYDLKDDPGETRDLVAAYPDLVATLDTALENHLLATGARIPYPNPTWNPALGPWGD